MRACLVAHVAPSDWCLLCVDRSLLCVYNVWSGGRRAHTKKLGFIVSLRRETHTRDTSLDNEMCLTKRDLYVSPKETYVVSQV